jgi:competence protein ComEC
LRSLLLLAGILLALWMPVERQGAMAWGLAGAIPVLALWRPVRPLLIAVGGAAYALLVAHRVAPLPFIEPGERVLVEARIDSVPALDDSGWQFDADINFPRQPEWPSQRWRVRLPAGMDGPATGELWQYALRFDPPRDAGERRLLLRDRVAAQARLVEGTFNQRLAAAGPGIDSLRARLARRMADRVADPSASALLAALAVGVTGEVSTRQWQVFNATGITHLVAISGMHVTFFAMLSMAAARRLWPLLAGLRAVPRRELFATWTGILLALLYALLSGFSVPAQRTVVMLTAFLLARECGRCSRPVWSVAVAIAAVLLFDPLAALSAGFWLSFLAVAAIVLLAGARLVQGAPLGGAARVQWLVSIALLPVTVAIFGSFSAVGLLANALAIPVFTLLLVPPVLLATACHLLPGRLMGWCGDLLVDLAAAVAVALWPFLSWCAGLPGALWRTEAPLSWFLLAVPAALAALLPLPRPLRGAGLALLASTFLLRDQRPREGELWIDVPDAGRSSAMMLRTRERLLLWGTAESFGARGRAFSRHVLPMLRSTGYRGLDLWLPGNLSRDTQVALALGSAELRVEQTLLPPARGVPPEMSHCHPGQWDWDGVAFELEVSSDGRACTLLASAGGPALLLGDPAAADLPAATGETLRLVLDAKGIRERRSHLRL